MAPATIMASATPAMIPFLVTIDVEGDNLWSKPRQIETRNAAFLARFQALCERYGLKPTYLTDYEMAMEPAYVAFGRDVLARRTAEIGMHLHAWNTPPLVPLTADDASSAPYLIEYPQTIQRQKIAFMTELLERTFATKMRSHRAGRWAFDSFYASVLNEQGYTADCSVTPHLKWTRHDGGAARISVDYRAFPAQPFWLNDRFSSVQGCSSLLEVPMTVVNPVPPALQALGVCESAEKGFAQRLARRFWPIQWLRPKGGNLKSMCAILARARRENWRYVEFMLHSSELMPGGSPGFPTPDSIAKLYDDLESLFDFAAQDFVGQTLDEFRQNAASSS